MRKIGLIILTFIICIDIYSQINKGNLLISIDGNYIKKNSENGVTSNHNLTNGKYLDLGFSAGHFLSNRLVLGVGLDYIREKEIRYNQTYNFNLYVQKEQMTIKSNTLMPNVYCAYYYPITNRLYVSSKIKLAYGKLRTEYSTLIASKSSIGIELGATNQYFGSALGVDYRSEDEYSIAGVYPELNYFISRKFCLNLGLGGIEYAMIDWNNDNSSLVINFNPCYWKVGLKLFLN
jgi:hypothetical protein